MIAAVEQRDADVCVVGAGFAGLAAARALAAHGKRVAVLEARDRVGGRAWNREMDDGTVVSVGGTWLGAGQDRMFALCADLGVATYPQYATGSSILGIDGQLHRYTGAAPRAHLFGLLTYAVALKRLSRMAGKLPLDAPWDAPDAIDLDAQTLADWIRSRRNIPSAVGRALTAMTLEVLFCVDASELSVLGALVLARGGGAHGFSYFTESKHTETHLIDGGPQLLAERMAAELGDSVVLGAPVRSISQTSSGVEVVADGCSVRAGAVVIAVPPVTTSSIRFDPALPADQTHLLNRMVPGAAIRVITTYDRPFWRSDGLTGISAVSGSAVVISIDQTPAAGSPGILSSYAFGSGALQMAALEPGVRRREWLSELSARFGPRAGTPVGYLETDWSAEQWSLGGMIGHLPPGALTSYGPALRRPAGRIHWAGAERATEMHGLMEGAVRSGERAAGEVIAAS